MIRKNNKPQCPGSPLRPLRKPLCPLRLNHVFKFGFLNLLLPFLIFGTSQNLFSQEEQTNLKNLPEIGLAEAIALSKENQALLESAKLKIEQAETVKKSAFDFGETQFFHSGEELGGENPGIYTTIGIRQQGIDLFGIAPKRNLGEQKTELALTKYRLFELKWERKVKKAWTSAFIAKRKLLLLRKLDSIYGKFLKAASLKYEVEQISRLELLAAQNKTNQIILQKNRAESNYQIALENLNLLLGKETQYGVPKEFPPDLLSIENDFSEELKSHVLLKIQQEKIELAEAQRKVSRAEFLPEIGLQYGLQEINGQDGFYNYEIGISVPLFSGPTYARAKKAKIEEQIAAKEAEFAQRRVETAYQNAFQNFQKWKQSWKNFQQKILPNTRQQRSSSLFAYREGALNYVALIQNLDASISTEFQALESLEQYLFSIFNLQFYTSNP